VSLAELRDETIALDVPGDNPDYDNLVVDACRRSGFEPRTRASALFIDAWKGAVHGEGCVGLTARSALQAAHRRLRLLALEEPITFPLDVVWRSPARPTLEAVVATARATSAASRAGASSRRAAGGRARAPRA
jgi:hypothetical protein